MEHSIISDMKNIARDYYKESSLKTMNDMVDYTICILEQMYDKTIIKKYIYREIIEQILSLEYRHLNNNYKLKLNKNRIRYLKSRVKYLQNKPQNEQRTDKWYEDRKNSIGASELACIFNKSPFCSYNKYLLKKIGYIEPISKDDKVSIHCLHGIKYEEIVQKIYCKRNNVTLLEFGSIQDEKYEWLRASPDGITTNGTMLEIKVPLSRKIEGLPPNYYWYQMQHQMKVCKLNECDFLECKIDEYTSWNEFIKDSKEGCNYISNNHLEKGVIIEYLNNHETDPWNKFGYVYPDNINMNLNEIYEWNLKIKHDLEQDINKQYTRIIPWKLKEYSCIKIYRNRHWWKEQFNIIETFWDDVLLYRECGYDSLLSTKKTRKKTIKEIEYAFISDD